MNQRRINIGLAALVAVVLATAVTVATPVSAQDARGGSTKGLVIGVSNRDMNEYFGTISNSIKAEGEKAGFTVVSTDSQNDLNGEGEIKVPISGVVPMRKATMPPPDRPI